MRNRWMIAGLSAALGAAALATGCKNITCGAGTTDPSGDTCVPALPPTECDPATTMAVTNSTTGVTTCVGIEAHGCSVPIACPAPATGKQSVCGQIINFETEMPFANPGATGTVCSGSAATTGPCALSVTAIDSVTTAPLTTGPITIDDCGRYIIPDIVAQSPFIGIEVDDLNAANMGPGGITEATAVGTTAQANATTKDLDAYMAASSALFTGGPPITGGMFLAVFYAHQTGAGFQSGVVATKGGATIPHTGAGTTASYFHSTDTLHGASDSIDGTATMTGANGTVVITDASPSDGLVYSGTGGLMAGCAWPEVAGMTVPFVLFVEEIRPIAINGMTCSQ